MPWVYSHSATQRMPLPHILPSLPSALKMRIMPSAPAVCAAPVSYTHLDVYKRQTLNNLPNYLGVSDNLDTVIEYIMARDITTRCV